MHVVIDIPEEEYNIIKKSIAPMTWIEHLIKDGTPLPKGHGDLKDMNSLLDRIGLEDNDSNREDNVGEIITLEDFDYIPTIIPADTESEE